MLIAIPDLHGRADLLEAALDYYPSDAKFVSLGDVIDRGPHSRAAVRRFLDLSDAGRAVLLRGNNEAMLYAAVECNRLWQLTGDHELAQAANDHFHHWSRNGGLSVLEEYGGFDAQNVPNDMIEYLNRTELTYEVNGYLCAHAAPPVPLPGYVSTDDVVMWARPTHGPFTLEPHIKASIHGHTPLTEPTWVGKHLYLDLGAVQTGALCTLNLENLETVVLQGSKANGREVLWELVSQQGGLIRPHPAAVIEISKRPPVLV